MRALCRIALLAGAAAGIASQFVVDDIRGACGAAGQLEECDGAGCVPMGFCPVAQPAVGLGYLECRDQDHRPANPDAAPTPVCSHLPGEWEECNGDCVPRGRKCSCRTEQCDAVTECLRLGPGFESCRGDCVPRGQCGVCDALAPGTGQFELCRGACVPRGDCLPDGLHDGGTQCTFCKNCPLELSFTLALPIEQVRADPGFNAALAADVSRITKVSTSRLRVTGVAPASVEVSMLILRSMDPADVTPSEALISLQTALELSDANDINVAICSAVFLGRPSACYGVADNPNLTPSCSVAFAGAPDTSRDDCPAGCTYAGTEAACTAPGVCTYTREVLYQSGAVKTAESCISVSFHNELTLAGAAVANLAVLANANPLPPGFVPCPAHSRGEGNGAACTCRDGFLGSPTWDAANGAYVGPHRYQLCDEVVPCATPSDYGGMFDVRGCVATPSGETCEMACAPGSKGPTTQFLCPAGNTDPYSPSAGSYPSGCQAAPMAADPVEIAQLLTIKGELADPPAISKWISAGEADDPCVFFWPGVGCDYRLGHIIRLSLRRLKLSGEIPGLIGRGLRNLQTLELDDNRFTGEIPFELGFFLRELTKLDLSKNMLTGGIHPYFRKLTKLTKLDLSDNLLVGYIPSILSDMVVLQRLSLRNNQFEGDLAPFVDSHDSLTHVDVSTNALTGMDHWWHNHTGLIELNLAHNQIGGTIPDFSPCTQLTKLLLHDNQLSGSIPPTLTTLRNLVDLRLANNNFNATVPTQWHVFSAMTFLDLSNNPGLTGTIPPELGGLSQLKKLHLHGLTLSGTVPSALVALSNLKNLYIRENLITGTLPNNLLGCTPPYTSSAKPGVEDCDSGVTFGWVDCSVRGAASCAESDGCRNDPCFKDDVHTVQCNDVPAPGAGFVCDPCPSGFHGDGVECFDIDDCALDANGLNPCDVVDAFGTQLVHGICTDTGPNSYVCDCAPDAKVCADVVPVGFSDNTRGASCTSAGDCVYTAFVQAVEYVAPVVGVNESCDAYAWNDGPAVTACAAVELDGNATTCTTAIAGCQPPGCSPRCVYTAAVTAVTEVLQVIGVEESCVARVDDPPPYRFSAGRCEENMPCEVVETYDCDPLATCVHLGPGQHRCDCPPGAYDGDGTVGNCVDLDACAADPCFDGPHPFNDAVACTDIVAECMYDKDHEIAAIMAANNFPMITSCADVMQLGAVAAAGGNPNPLQCADNFFLHGPLELICPISCGVCTLEQANTVAAGVGFVCGPCPSGYAGDGVTCEDINDCIDANGNNPCDVRNPSDPGGAVLVSGDCTDQGPNLYSCLYAAGSGR